MSNLLSQASLVMIPSGYKEDVVYSQIPTSGSGDLSFTRASNGTRINSAGLVEDVPWNLLTYSEEFNNAIWTKSEITISANSTNAPNGTTTADTLIPTTVSAIHRVSSPVNRTSGNSYTLSVYAKASGYNFLFINAGTAFNAQSAFNLSNGTISTTVGTASIESVGDGWYRCIVVGTASASGASTVFFQINSTTSTPADQTFTGNGTSGIFLWGAQLNIGATAKPYFPTTDRLNVPRLTYQNGGGGCPSVLLEPQRTNSILRSEEFDNAAWTKTASTVTANSTISPDGTQNADTLTGNGISSTHSVFQSASLTSGANYTISVYAKKNTNNFLQIYGFSTGYGVNSWANFDLNNGVVGSVGSSASATITNVGNGWYRCTISIVAVSTATDAFVLNLITSATSSRGENSTLSTSVFLWGCQFEQGAYPTTYIPTTSATATRVADAFSRNNIYTNGLITSSGGTWFVELLNNVAYTRDGISTGLFIDTNASSYTNGINIRNGGGGSTRLVISKWVGGTGTPLFTTTTDTVKIAVKWNGTTADVFVNGTKQVSATSFTPTAMQFVKSEGNQVPVFISQMGLFPTPLTDAECQALTTL